MPRAAAGVAVLSCAVYAAAVYARWQWHGRSEPPRVVIDDHPGGRVSYYKVTTATGEVHVHPADDGDPARLLLDVAARYGQGTSMERVDARAARVLAGPSRPPLARYAALVLAFPAALLLVGLSALARARQRRAVWEVVKPALAVDAKHVLARTRLSPKRLASVVGELRDQGVAALEWDDKSDRIYDTRLSLYHVGLPFCPSCDAPARLRATADLNELPRCTTCGQPADRERLRPLTAELVGRLSAERVAPSSAARGDCNVAVLALLALLLPPAAIVYALVRQ